MTGAPLGSAGERRSGTGLGHVILCLPFENYRPLGLHWGFYHIFIVLGTNGRMQSIVMAPKISSKPHGKPAAGMIQSGLYAAG